MAIDLGTATKEINTKDRLWRAELFIDDSDNGQLRFHRELAAYEAGALKSRDKAVIPSTNRTQDQVKTKSYTAGGLTATGQQILALLNKMADDERQYDIDNPPATPGP